MKEITLKDYEQKANAVIELGFNVVEKNLGRIILALIEEIRRLKNLISSTKEFNLDSRI